MVFPPQPDSGLGPSNDVKVLRTTWHAYDRHAFPANQKSAYKDTFSSECQIWSLIIGRPLLCHPDADSWDTAGGLRPPCKDLPPARPDARLLHLEWAKGPAVLQRGMQTSPDTWSISVGAGADDDP